MYDVDGNGWIDLEEMTRLVGSIYKMLGQHQLVQQVSQEFTFCRFIGDFILSSGDGG